MSLNIAPNLPQLIANSAAPATESLAHSNAVKDVVPAPTQVEAYVPQKSREQDARSPEFENPTYDDIQKQSDPEVIPDGDDQEEQAGSQNQSPDDNSEESDAVEARAAEGSDDSNGNSSSEASEENEITQRAEEAEQKAELQEIRELESRDAEVRAHELAHAAVGGQYAGAPRYQYETGPNGQKYAVSGQVSIDVSPEDTPEETISKMQTVRAAALAPAEPSSQDRKVAAEASQQIADARADLVRENAEVRASRSSGADSDEEGPAQTVQVNTDSHVANEPRKRSLQGEGAVAANQTETLQDQEFLKIAEVIEQRYYGQNQRSEQGFQTVA